MIHEVICSSQAITTELLCPSPVYSYWSIPSLHTHLLLYPIRCPPRPFLHSSVHGRHIVRGPPRTPKDCAPFSQVILSLHLQYLNYRLKVLPLSEAFVYRLRAKERYTPFLRHHRSFLHLCSCTKIGRHRLCSQLLCQWRLFFFWNLFCSLPIAQPRLHVQFLVLNCRLLCLLHISQEISVNSDSFVLLVNCIQSRQIIRCSTDWILAYRSAASSMYSLPSSILIHGCAVSVSFFSESWK